VVENYQNVIYTLKEYTLKIIAILTFVFILFGCSSKEPMSANLMLQLDNQLTGKYSDESSAALRGHDARQDASVIIFQLEGEPDIRLPNQTAPHLLVTEQLANGLREQGLVFKSNSPVRIQLDLNELLVSVTHPKLLYSAKAKSNLTLTIKNGKVTLTKTYNRQATNDSVTRPSVHELEEMLNSQLTNIVSQILQDEEVQTTIR